MIDPGRFLRDHEAARSGGLDSCPNARDAFEPSAVLHVGTPARDVEEGKRQGKATRKSDMDGVEFFLLGMAAVGVIALTAATVALMTAGL